MPQLYIYWYLLLFCLYSVERSIVEVAECILCVHLFSLSKWQELTFPVAEFFLEDVLEKTRYNIKSEFDNVEGNSRRRRQQDSKKDPLMELFEAYLHSHLPNSLSFLFLFPPYLPKIYVRCHFVYLSLASDYFIVLEMQICNGWVHIVCINNLTLCVLVEFRN